MSFDRALGKETLSASPFDPSTFGTRQHEGERLAAILAAVILHLHPDLVAGQIACVKNTPDGGLTVTIDIPLATS